MFSLLLGVLLVFRYCAAQNVICNGDFQAYILTRKVLYYTGEYVIWKPFPENYSCWYRYPSGNIQVQTQSYAPYHTRTLQLIVNFSPYTLCQKVTIQTGQSYSLSLNCVKPIAVSSATIFLYLNKILVRNITNKNYLVSSKLVYNFTATVNIYQICINGSVVCNSYTKLYLDDFNPLIDNVSLVLISSNFNNNSISNSSSINITETSNSTTNNINDTDTNDSILNPANENNLSNLLIEILLVLQLTYDEDNGSILLRSTHPLDFSKFYYFQTFGKIYIEHEEQRNIFISYNNDTQLFNVTLIVSREYDIKTMYASFPPQVIEAYQFRMKILINGKDVYLYLISQNMMKVVNTIQPISSALTQGVSKCYSMLKLTFCSYFVMSMINFYSLTLMYNFLGLPAQPVFSRTALEKLSLLFYKRNNLFQYLQGIFKSFDLKQSLQFQGFMSNDDQRVEKFNNGFSWFGNMGITSNFLANNLENIVLIIILILKLSLLTLFQSLFPHLTFQLFGKMRNFAFVVLSQFICMSPLMTVSAFSNFMNSGCSQFNYKIIFVMHLGLSIIILLCPFFYLFGICKYIKKGGVKRKNQKNIKIIKMKFIEYLFNILLPVLSVISNEIAFFVVISLYLILLVPMHFRTFFSYSILSRIFKSIMNLILLTHHLSFMLMYLTGIVRQKLQFNQTLNQCCKVAGLIVIFTVLCGGLMEIIYIIIEILIKILKKIKKCCQQLKKIFYRKSQKNKSINKNQNNFINKIKEKTKQIDNKLYHIRLKKTKQMQNKQKNSKNNCIGNSNKKKKKLSLDDKEKSLYINVQKLQKNDPIMIRSEEKYEQFEWKIVKTNKLEYKCKIIKVQKKKRQQSKVKTEKKSKIKK